MSDIDQTPVGFEIPVHRSLTEPETIAGVPSTVAIANGTITLAMAYALMSPWPLLIGVGIHVFAVSACASDPEILQVFLISIRDRARRLDV